LPMGASLVPAPWYIVQSRKAIVPWLVFRPLLFKGIILSLNQKVRQNLFEKRKTMNSKLSYISEKATIGDNVVIGNFCHIEDGVVLEDNVSIGNYSMIMSGTRIGRNTKVGTYTKVGANCKIGSDCNFTSYCEIRDNCRLGDHVSMGSRCTLSANTIVEDHVLMKYAFVVTDTPVLAENEVKKTGTLKRGSKFGANVTIMPAVTVGENSEIGACSQVRNDVPDNEVWYGNPAKFYRKFSK